MKPIARDETLPDGRVVEVRIRPWRDASDIFSETVMLNARLNCGTLVEWGRRAILRLTPIDPLPPEFAEHPDVQRVATDALHELQQSRDYWIRKGAA